MDEIADGSSRARTHDILFIVRCSGAATAAYELAAGLGLAEASWAAISAIIVSQQRLHHIGSSLAGRIAGTLVGIAATMLVSQLATQVAAPIGLQMAVAVAISALVASRFPQLGVAMWTCPILLLGADPTAPISAIALRRGAEVILGAIVGWAFHRGTEMLSDRLI